MLKLLAFIGFSLVLLGCGPRAERTSALDIVGGQDVMQGSPAFTATVSLSRKSRKGFDSFCSGTLVAPTLVLTAAHCLDGFRSPKQFVILFGASDRDGEAETRSVNAFASYRPDGSRYFPNYDVAWVKLDEPAPARYQPAEILRSEQQLRSILGKDDALLLAGYGRTSTECTVSEAGCSGKLLQTRSVLRRFVNTPHFVQLLVVGPKPQSGSCQGDSGGPAFAAVRGRWYLVGHLNGKSLSLNSPAVWDAARICESGESVYTFAGPYADWLEQSSGVSLTFDDERNPRGAGLAVAQASSELGPRPDLVSMLRFNNPDEPLWVSAEALFASFGDEDKREIPKLEQVVTDPVRAAAAMASWESFSYRGEGFNINTLELTDRQLSDLRPIAALKNLRRLELVGNRLSDLSALGELQNLQELILGQNYDFRTKARIPYDLSFLSRLKKLRVLSLAANSGSLQLAHIPWASLQGLEVLNLSGNESLELDQVPFASLPKLRTLIVSNAGLTHIEGLAEARSLRSIDLRNNNIQDISVLKQLPELQTLDLSQNQIEDFSTVAELKELKRLKALANPQRVTACPERAECLYNPEAARGPE